jgi:hypothetical protein
MKFFKNTCKHVNKITITCHTLSSSNTMWFNIRKGIDYIITLEKKYYSMGYLKGNWWNARCTYVLKIKKNSLH